MLSRAKFWQMIGRGTRICEGLIDGDNKQQFYIFDLCKNFEFFRLHAKVRAAGTVTTLQERMFNIQIEIIFKLQKLFFQTDELKEYREHLIQDLVKQVNGLPRENFAVKQHLRVIDKYQTDDDFASITYVLSVEWKESQLENDDLVKYKKQVNYYITQHQNIPTIAKRKGNVPLSKKMLKLLKIFYGVSSARRSNMIHSMEKHRWVS